MHSLRPFIVSINTTEILSSRFERSISAMNNTVTWKINTLTPKHIILSLLLIQYDGPLTNIGFYQVAI